MFQRMFQRIKIEQSHDLPVEILWNAFADDFLQILPQQTTISRL